LGGWSNALFSAAGASATAEGTPVIPAATLQVEREHHRLTVILPPAALGHPATLRGARIHVNTWDYDGGYRELATQPSAFRFGGGDDARDPKWMDRTGVIVVDGQ